MIVGRFHIGHIFVMKPHTKSYETINISKIYRPNEKEVEPFRTKINSDPANGYGYIARNLSTKTQVNKA